MADNSVLTQSGQFEQQFNRKASMIRCAMPGKIGSFDPETQRCVVLPTVKMKIVQGAQVTYTALPEIQNVPIVFPYGFAGKVLLTHPIKEGDPCLLVFSDRALDNVLQTGDLENPDGQQNSDTTSPRAHHLSDAICIPGLIADPQVVPDWNQDNIELRDFDRKVYFSLGPEGITMTDGTAVYTMKEGKVTLDAPAGIEETSSAKCSRTTSDCNELVGTNVDINCAGENTISGTVNITNGDVNCLDGTFVDTNGRDSSAHIHSGIVQGTEDTGPTSGNA